MYINRERVFSHMKFHISLINFINSYNIQCLIEENVIGLSPKVLITTLHRNRHVLGICFYHCNELKNICSNFQKYLLESQTLLIAGVWVPIWRRVDRDQPGRHHQPQPQRGAGDGRPRPQAQPPDLPGVHPPAARHRHQPQPGAAGARDGRGVILPGGRGRGRGGQVLAVHLRGAGGHLQGDPAEDTRQLAQPGQSTL